MYLFLTATTPEVHIKLHCHNFAFIPDSNCLLPHFTIHCTWLACFPYLWLSDFLQRCIPEVLFSQWLYYIHLRTVSLNSSLYWLIPSYDHPIPFWLVPCHVYLPLCFVSILPGAACHCCHMFSSASLVMVSFDAVKFVCCRVVELMSTSHPFAPQALGARNSTMNQNALMHFSFSSGVSSGEGWTLQPSIPQMMAQPCGLGLPLTFWAMLFSMYPTLQGCTSRKTSVRNVSVTRWSRHAFLFTYSRGLFLSACMMCFLHSSLQIWWPLCIPPRMVLSSHQLPLPLSRQGHKESFEFHIHSC